ncbi:uncharacterized protein MYCGRDRAFT_95579 [Zymoseptoria tritici IPO323]|uniref:Uncharacterized protein n=1 Tax=Zymoseptoria tritici (strain CBS 115943 / IPO323) TaxID=336722 RepID=F9XJ51_ZYMTI|nr:uncharacterized protein MYCGRDRAFT_95579 [Zymoseptoria tritici IPO323]EGP84776.1 hypothetical protein MYCGRDRAFT_95579 [Zymoseptoria tritici IPO323]
MQLLHLYAILSLASLAISDDVEGKCRPVEGTNGLCDIICPFHVSIMAGGASCMMRFTRMRIVSLMTPIRTIEEEEEGRRRWGALKGSRGGDFCTSIAPSIGPDGNLDVTGSDRALCFGEWKC